MATHVHRHGSESDGARGRAGDAHRDRHRAGRHSTDVAGERGRAAELPLLGRRHVVRELGARQGARLRDARPAHGIHVQDRRSGAEGRDRPRPVPEEPAEPDRPHGRQRPADRRDPCGAHGARRRSEPDAARLRALERPMGQRRDLATDARQRHPAGPPPFISFMPKLTCARLRADRSVGLPATADNPSNMGFWYQNADLGPLGARCTTSTGSPPKFDTASGRSDNSINWSATSHHGDQPDAGRVLHVQVRRLDDLGELSWNASTNLLTRQGDDLHRRQHHHQPGATAGTRARRHRRLGNVRDEELNDLRHSSGLHGRL